MMKFLRSQSQTVLWIVLGVIALGFLFYGNSGNFLTTNSSGRLSNDFGRIDGEDLSAAQLFNTIRETRCGIMLGSQSQILHQTDAAKQVAEIAWRQLLLLREADRLHIEVSDSQLLNAIRDSPIFKDDKTQAFSPMIYQVKMSDLQNNLHISPDEFENIIRNNIRLEAVTNALFSSIRTSPSEIAGYYEKYYGLTALSVITFDPKAYADAIQPTPEEIAAEYKAHPENPAYRTKEKRKVDYVLFPLTPDQVKLQPKEKVAAKQALGEKALDFAVSLQPDPAAAGKSAPLPDFVSEAKKRNLTPVTTDFFTTDTPPTSLPPSPSFNNAAFGLTKENPISKVVELEDGVAVIHLVDIQPSDLRPLEEVKADVVKQIQQTKGAEAKEAAIKTAVAGLKISEATGTDFKDAAAALNLKVETPHPLIPMLVENTERRLKTISSRATTLAVGQTSDPIALPDKTTIIIHVDKRDKADPGQFPEFEDRFRSYKDQGLRQQIVADWAEWRSKTSGTHKPPDLDQYGGME